MIEATNAIVAGGAVGQTHAAAASRPQPQQTERPQPPQAPYISPRVRVDVDLDRAILEIRDSDTGEVVDSFPTEQQIAAFERANTADRAVAQQTVGESESTAPATTTVVEAPQPQDSAVSAPPATDVFA